MAVSWEEKTAVSMDEKTVVSTAASMAGMKDELRVVQKVAMWVAEMAVAKVAETAVLMVAC